MYLPSLVSHNASPAPWRRRKEDALFIKGEWAYFQGWVHLQEDTVYCNLSPYLDCWTNSNFVSLPFLTAPPPENIGVFPYFEPLFEGLPPMMNSEGLTSPPQGTFVRLEVRLTLVTIMFEVVLLTEKYST